MEIKVLQLGNIDVNCYLISTEKTAIVIDPGFRSNEALEFLLSAPNKQRLILLSHGHFDHIGYANELRENTDTNIAIGALDEPALSDTFLNLSYAFGVNLAPFKADLLINDGETISIGDVNLTAIHTPGHTVGSMSFSLDNYLFSGDTLFNGSIGRTDFPGGDFQEIKNSILKLYELPDDITILSGHGEATNIGFEKTHNPFVRG